ncbi:nramp family mn2+ fe2+ transporters containing protein [Stylonychia lemnae]|uniref:Nramp family mn2+ fe2+ transporters containing protein n=1 Tax=Stylonychia lemnae TaxID=5949 RepID=A0A078AI33_STYLE|nr:nramp family mn2+ fe2+ transporters containing protein [Stylonychia lemnae]|eukprot:CDW81910.1 nramp family mn2+ fe2+ transporters containing protein [Stylonychia lemnae]
MAILWSWTSNVYCIFRSRKQQIYIYNLINNLVAGDLDAGNSAGYRLLWILLTSTCLGLFFQILAARLGVVTQRNLARNCREQFPKHGFFAFLIGTMAICFFVNFFIVGPDVGSVFFGTFVPTIPSGTLSQAIGLVGAVIMPHNLYLHSALVLSRKIDNKNQKQVYEANYYNAVESGISLFVSFLINFSVVGTFAYYHDKGLDDLNLRSADVALEQAFGNAARIIWGIGLLAAGQSSTMTGTYAGQFVMEGFFDIKLTVWKRVLVTRSIAILPALAVAFIQDFDDVDTYLNILQSIQLPFALIPLLKFTSSPKVMGKFSNGKCPMYFSVIMACFLFAINVYNLIPIGVAGWIYAPFAIGFALYLTLIIIVIRTPIYQLKDLEEEYDDDQIAKITIADYETASKSQ